ncbi:MAG: 4Fe-4S binding protein [Smithellaceae bacterium]
MILIRIRKAVSGFLLLLFVMLFAGGEEIATFLAGILPPFQFVPALLRTISHPAALFAFGLLFIALITLVFGRVYCSFLCPLGALQDVFGALGRKLGLRSDFSFSKPHNALRYTIMAITFAALAIGLMSVVILLDPYSIAGRFFSYFLQPVFVWTYNLSILLLKPFDIYLYPKQTAVIPLPDTLIAAVFLTMIVYLSVKHGRLYCNTVCPVGSVLGLLARVSIFKLSLNQARCKECERCENVCKANCINPHLAVVDMSRCVACFNCLAACSQSTIRYRLAWRKTNPPTWSPARRRFVIGGIAAAAALLFAWNHRLRHLTGIARTRVDQPVTPPGSLNLSRFTQACTACSLCVAACPTSVLAPSFGDYGPAGLMQPKLNFEKSYCEYECHVCGRVCPTGAITQLSLDEKKLTQIGEAKLLEDVCVVYVDHNNCGACGEVCPTHAIRFVDKENILYPEIDTRYCIGCGACQLACPTTPRSIVVNPHPVHKKADKYIMPDLPAEPARIEDRDFPF